MATSKQGAQGTGKHPHKSAAEPYPHTKDGGSKGGKSADDGKKRARSDGDLASREYKDKDGNVHHHTRSKAREA